jgi:hypothetical protein
MTEQVQQEQVEIRVGFEKALTMLNPDWRNALSKDQVNQFRHFYHMGVMDTNMVANLNAQNFGANVQAIMNTILVTGREDEIEAQRQAAIAAAEAPTEVPGGGAEAGEVTPEEDEGSTEASDEVPAAAVESDDSGKPCDVQ